MSPAMGDRSPARKEKEGYIPEEEQEDKEIDAGADRGIEKQVQDDTGTADSRRPIGNTAPIKRLPSELRTADPSGYPQGLRSWKCRHRHDRRVPDRANINPLGQEARVKLLLSECTFS